ncbi:MAG TPA: GNAT family N-acetyltransferase [Candidatus Acidoferrales bacterium]|jgi:CelD/BcsL family acetyltransferase involved in cellulose biosynthesis|nr:GNAT family N-acetyltransferase [Candidatus Acidoferrales bacterium]
MVFVVVEFMTSWHAHLLLTILRLRRVLQLQVLRSAHEMPRLRSAWERIRKSASSTVFQDFEWNLLAARLFADREAPFVVYARSSGGETIIPAVIRSENSRSTLRLLGDELFDYRKLLHSGDDETLRSALGCLAELGCPLHITALRQSDARTIPAELTLERFTTAPGVSCRQLSPETFAQMHLRLARNLRRMQRLGFELRSYDGSRSQLLRSIYQIKAEQDRDSLFRDPLRQEFMVQAALLDPARVEVFVLESGSHLGAALVTLLDPGVRRFYTCWFSPELAKHSPALSLIYEVTRLSLDAGLDCDYMTGEQAYKMRLATNAVHLFHVNASQAQLASAAQASAHELKMAS